MPGMFLGSWDISASKMGKESCPPRVYMRVLTDRTLPNNGDNDDNDNDDNDDDK